MVSKFANKDAKNGNFNDQMEFRKKSIMFTLMILIAAFLLFCLLAAAVFKKLSIGWSLKKLFKDFNRKMWMTLSLAVIFSIFYLFIIHLLTAFVIPQWGSDLLALGLKKPVAWIYCGLWLFAFFSLSIYLARMVIKYLYLLYGKDS